MARHGVWGLVLLTCVIGACAGAAPSSSDGPPSSFEPMAPSASPTSPLPAPLGVVDYVSATAAPGDAGDATVRGWLGRLPAMGWEAPYIEPAWLAYPPDEPNVALWQRGPGGDELCGGEAECAFLILHLPPQSSITLGEVARWVDVVGHRNDPAAETCHYVFDEPWSGPTPATVSAVETCRAEFVVVELREAPAP